MENVNQRMLFVYEKLKVHRSEVCLVTVIKGI